MNTNDEKIVEIMQALYKKNAPALVYYAAKIANVGIAEDLVQDVFLQLWQRRSFILWSENISAYLFQAVRHACLDYIRHQEVKINYENDLRMKLKIDELYYTDPQDIFLNEDNRLQSIYKQIEQLPEKCCKIFKMAYLEERKTIEIASLLSISKRTVEAQLYKALKTIRESLLKK